MTDIIRKDYVEVSKVHISASDEMVIAAARVSTLGTDSQHYLATPAEEGAGLIRFLMSNRHGTPFEHNLFQFFVSAPIFVFREFHRHRIGFSYNEESGRYKQLEPVFYVPPRGRPGLMAVPDSKPGQYVYRDATDSDHTFLVEHLSHAYDIAYEEYETLLAAGFSKEVARMCLPVSLYTSMWVTCNARSMMSFLSLRQKHTAEDALFPSKPMHEINAVADLMEFHFKEAMPITHAAYVAAKRVAP